MKFFKNTNIWQKLVIALLVVICFQVMFVPTVEASGAAGILFEPINMFVLFLGDAGMSILHASVMDQSETTINISVTDSWFWAILVGIVLIVGVILFFATGGTFAILLTAIKVVVGTLVVGVAVAIPIDLLGDGTITESPTMVYEIDNVPNDLVLPLYSLSPEEIFKNQIGLFNINFFNPESGDGNATFAWGIIPEGQVVSISQWLLNASATNSEYTFYKSYNYTNDTDKVEQYPTEALIKPTYIERADGSGGYYDITTFDSIDLKTMEATRTRDNGAVETIEIKDFYIQDSSSGFQKANSSVVASDWQYYYVKKTGTGEYQPYSITFLESNPDIESQLSIEYWFYIEDDGSIHNSDTHIKTSKVNVALELQPIISQWYVALRNLAIILMLTILLYIGIRMMLTSVAAEKSKYKQMLTSWFIGMCLLVFIHYLMVFSVTIVEEFTRLITDPIQDSVETPYNLIIKNIDEDAAKSEAITNAMTEIGKENYITDIDGQGGDNDFIWITNLMGQYRMASQMSVNSASQLMYTIGFIVLVTYTLIFSYIYLKRVLYLAFLTIIAPLVAMTYPIDTIADGQAQGFNKWLREYLFNLIMQPFHLLLYTILVSSALELSSSNMLYMLVALGFLIPAEKFLRSLFGFSKSETAGSFAGAATGAALMMGAVNKAIGMGNGKKGKNSSQGGNDSGGNDSGGIRYSSDDPTDALLNGNNLGLQDADKDEKDNINTGNQNTHQLDDHNNGYSDFDNGYGSYMDGDNQNSTDEYDNFDYGMYDFDPDGLNVQEEVNNEDINIQDTNTIRTAGNVVNNNEDKDVKLDQENQEEQPSIIHTPSEERRANLRGIAAFGKSVGGSVGKGVIKGLSNAPKVAIKGYGAAVAGGIAGSFGLAAAITSGDVGNVKTYAGGAAIAGGAVGANLTGRALGQKNNKALQRAVDEYRRAAEGTNYKANKKEQEYKDWTDNTEAMYKLEDKFGKAKVKEMMNNESLKTYYQNGFTNARDIKKLEDMKEAKIVKDAAGAVAIHKLATTYGNVHQDQKKYDNALNKLSEKYKGKDGVGSKHNEIAKKTVDKISKAYNEGLI